MHPIPNKITTDVLIIGGGAAGIRAALAASGEGVQVLLLTEGRPTRHGATFAGPGPGWGYQALLGAERSARNLEFFYNEIIQAGLGCCDPELARMLVEESGPRLEDLLAFGLALQMDDRHRFLRVPGCFSPTPRAFLARDRRNIRATFGKMLRRSGAATLNASALSLLIYENACRGAWALTASGEPILVRAKAVVLASGGAAGLFLHHACPADQIGRGYALALMVGAELKNLEFIQFVLGVKQSRKPELLPINRLEEPVLLTDSEGRDIIGLILPGKQGKKRALDQRQSHAPFSCRDDSALIDLEIALLNQKAKKVLWHDPSSVEPLEVLHLAQAFNGGLKINSRAETTLANLFAAGEVAAGPHGADRIGGCMLTATQVFGARAGQAAAERARKTDLFPEIPVPEECKSSRDPGSKDGIAQAQALIKAARRIFTREVTLLRDRKGLQSCLQFLSACLRKSETLSVSAPSRIKLQHSLTTMAAITRAALARNHSLGPHYRTDDPTVHRKDAEIAEKK